MKIPSNIINLFGIIIALIQAICAVISIRLAIPDRKEILYRVSTCGDRYLIAFWNCCRTVITKDDLLHFYICAKTDSTCNVAYSSNIEYRDVKIQDSCSRETQDYHTGRSFCKIFRMFDIEFEILPPKEGFFITLDNTRPDEGGQLQTILVNGLLKNGPMHNCVAFEHDNSVLEKITTSHRITNVLYGILTVVIILSNLAWGYLFFQPYLMKDSTLAFNIVLVFFFWFLISGSAFIIGVQQFILFRMPFRLFWEYRRIVKKNGAKQSYKDFRYKFKAPLRSV